MYIIKVQAQLEHSNNDLSHFEEVEQWQDM